MLSAFSFQAEQLQTQDAGIVILHRAVSKLMANHGPKHLVILVLVRARRLATWNKKMGHISPKWPYICLLHFEVNWKSLKDCEGVWSFRSIPLRQRPRPAQLREQLAAPSWMLGAPWFLPWHHPRRWWWSPAPLSRLAADDVDASCCSFQHLNQSGCKWSFDVRTFASPKFSGKNGRTNYVRQGFKKESSSMLQESQNSELIIAAPKSETNPKERWNWWIVNSRLRSNLSPAVASLERSPVRPGGRPPSAAPALPGRVASLERGRAAPSPHGTGTGSSHFDAMSGEDGSGRSETRNQWQNTGRFGGMSGLYALSSSEGSQPQVRPSDFRMIQTGMGMMYHDFLIWFLYVSFAWLACIPLYSIIMSSSVREWLRKLLEDTSWCL